MARITPHYPARDALGRFTNGGENRFRRLWRFALKPNGELCVLSILSVRRRRELDGEWELRWFPGTTREVSLLKPERVAKLPNHRRWDWCRVEDACTADYEVARHGLHLDQGLCHTGCPVELLGPAQEQELEGVRDPRSRGKRGAEWLDTLERVSKGAYTKC